MRVRRGACRCYDCGVGLGGGCSCTRLRASGAFDIGVLLLSRMSWCLFGGIVASGISLVVLAMFLPCGWDDASVMLQTSGSKSTGCYGVSINHTIMPGRRDAPRVVIIGKSGGVAHTCLRGSRYDSRRGSLYTRHVWNDNNVYATMNGVV